jgi:hypothetical protein
MTSNGNSEDPRRRLLIKALAAGSFSSVVVGREAFAQVLGRRALRAYCGHDTLAMVHLTRFLMDRC